MHYIEKHKRLDIIDKDCLIDLVDNNIISELSLSKGESNYIKDKFNYAFEISRIKFSWNKRLSWEDYFEHLKKTCYLILNYFPNPNIDKVIIALLHDIKEDTNIECSTIRSIFWDYISDSIDVLTKKDLNNYIWNLSKTEIIEFEYDNIVSKLKNYRNEDYFSTLLNCSDINILDVKFADRLDNIQTIWICDMNKIIQKIYETQRYIMPLAMHYNKTAYKMLLEEINSLKIALNLSY